MVPIKFWPRFEDKEVINENELEHRKKLTDTLQCECIVKEFKKYINITRFSSVLKLTPH